MSDSQDTMIGQLWFDQFLEEDGRSRFEVHAASPHLFDASGERIEYLKRYASYRLPPGAESPLPSISSLDAPESLAFIRTEHGERILVRKVYENSLKRTTYMLVGLPPEFSAREAIILWGSSF